MKIGGDSAAWGFTAVGSWIGLLSSTELGCSIETRIWNHPVLHLITNQCRERWGIINWGDTVLIGISWCRLARLTCWRPKETCWDQRRSNHERMDGEWAWRWCWDRLLYLICVQIGVGEWSSVPHINFRLTPDRPLRLNSSNLKKSPHEAEMTETHYHDSVISG